MKTNISLDGLHFHAFHGYYEEERIMGNPFILHVNVELGPAVDSDNISDTVNYEHIYQICKEEMENTQKLLETVVVHIVDKLKSRFTQILGGTVTLEKIGPQLGGHVEKATVSVSF